MPSHRCKHPTCPAIIDEPGYCAAHAGDEQTTAAARQLYYDRHLRDPAAKRFYDSAAWQRCRTSILAEQPVCQQCERTWAAHVHHKIPLARCTDEQKLDPENLLAVCLPCHNLIEGREAETQTPHARGMLTIVEDEQFWFDAAGAEKPIAFIEKYCQHYEGKWVGQPFKLLDWQQHIIRQLFGWKSRATGLRRFRELYLITAKGSGKTPLLAGIGLYMLLGDGEASPHVLSIASTYQQATLSFDTAKRYIEQSPKLQKHAVTQALKILAPRVGGKWDVVSGKPNGRSGARPNCCLADEVHEWPDATGIAFGLLTANMFKRAQPLVLMATNAGANRTSFAWQVHERAMKVLNGTSRETTIFPVIFESPPEMDWQSEQAAKAANPSLGSIITFDQLEPELVKAQESPAGEANYRRLYLSQWVAGVAKWLDMAKYDAVCRPIDPPKGAPLYIGLDLSQGDDLCAAAKVWVQPDFYHVDCQFWLPKATAEHYAAKHLLPFRQWGESGAIELLDEPTVSQSARLKIADSIIETSKANTLVAVCYDPYKAEDCIAKLEAAGIVCIPVRQGFTLSGGCDELERRITELSIAIAANPVLRWNAENTEVMTDSRGNRWPVKPGAKAKYAGTRQAKIDGVVAVVTALTEARKHAWPKSEMWGGAISVV